MPLETDSYALGYDRDVVSKLNSRSGHREGAFLLPHLHNDMNMLDIGCGPGSISREFARVLDHGRVTGIDIDAQQIKLAEQAAERDGINNIEFKECNVYQLPFDDNSFDVAFVHTVFMHISDPRLAMLEIRRVLRPSGIIALREGLGAFEHFAHSTERYIKGGISNLLRRVTELSNGSADIGMRLKGLLLSLDFSEVFLQTYSEIYDHPDDLEMIGQWYRSLLKGRVGEIAVQHGLLSNRNLNQLISSMSEWQYDHEALSIVVWVEYLARKT